MYRIGILEHDETYLWRLVGFLKEHHKDSFEINVADGGFGLDAVDIKGMDYDALFLGDGVEGIDVKTDEIPAHIVIGYLTENDADGEQYISKYQSMEQIYKQMIRLCETAKLPEAPADDGAEEEEAENCFQAENETVNGETYRVYHIEEDQVDRLAVRMLTGNRIRGLAQTEYREGRLKIRITGMKSLYAYICENNTPKGKEQLLKFLANMIATALSLEEYMLSMDKLLLNPKEIYVNETNGKIVMPYIPLKDAESKDSGQCLAAIEKMCAMLSEGLSSEENLPMEPDDACGNTEAFDRLQNNAKESLKLKERTKALGRGNAVTYIIRKRTGEKVVINRNLFKIGKDASYVDYCIKDNPAVSRNHADIVRKADGFYLVDKGSLNHTFIDGRKLEAGEYRKLSDGCLMQLADDVFEFRSLTK